MVLLHGLYYGADLACLHGTGTKSNHSLCYAEGVQD